VKDFIKVGSKTRQNRLVNLSTLSKFTIISTQRRLSQYVGCAKHHLTIYSGFADLSIVPLRGRAFRYGFPGWSLGNEDTAVPCPYNAILGKDTALPSPLYHSDVTGIEITGPRVPEKK
jgi:hypothetical protein